MQTETEGERQRRETHGESRWERLEWGGRRWQGAEGQLLWPEERSPSWTRDVTMWRVHRRAGGRAESGPQAGEGCLLHPRRGWGLLGEETQGRACPGLPWPAWGSGAPGAQGPAGRSRSLAPGPAELCVFRTVAGPLWSMCCPPHARTQQSPVQKEPRAGSAVSRPLPRRVTLTAALMPLCCHVPLHEPW